MNRRVLVVIAVVAALGMTGCSSPTGPDVLAREATAEDELPEAVSLISVDTDIKAGSARLLATHDDVEYFAAKSSTGGSACLITVPVGLPERWRAGCAALATGEDIVTLTNFDDSQAKLINDGVDAGQPKYDGWTQIHPNVLVSSR